MWCMNEKAVSVSKWRIFCTVWSQEVRYCPQLCEKEINKSKREKRRNNRKRYCISSIETLFYTRLVDWGRLEGWLIAERDNKTWKRTSTIRNALMWQTFNLIFENLDYSYIEIREQQLFVLNFEICLFDYSTSFLNNFFKSANLQNFNRLRLQWFD